MALPARDHRISVDAAASLAKACRDARASAVNAGASTQDALMRLPDQAASAGFLLIAKGLACKPAR